MYGLIGFKLYVKHPGMGPYQHYGNYDFWSVITDVSDIQTNQMFKRYLLRSLGPIGCKFYVRHPCVWSTKIMEIIIFGLLFMTYQTFEQTRFPYLLTW